MEKTLLTIIIFQSLLLVLTLLSSWKRANNVLILYFSHIFLSALFFSILDGSLGNELAKSEVVRVIFEFIVLCRTVVILYFLYFLLDKKIPKIYHYLWLLPVLNLIADYSLRIMDPYLYYRGFYNNWYFNFPFYVKILLVLLLVKLAFVYKKEIRENRSTKTHQELISLYWGKYIVYFLLTLSAFLLIYIAFTLLNGRLFALDSSLFRYTADYYNIIYYSFNALFLFVFSYLIMRSSSIFNNGFNDASIEQKIVEMVLPAEEKTSAVIEFSYQQMHDYAVIITRLMVEEKVFLDTELSLDKLAELSGIKSRALSQFIQLAYSKKYKDFVNEYRVSEAQKNLTDSNLLSSTMYAVAIDSGFNSESTFYKVFKEQTGLTPKQYRESSIPGSGQTE